MSRQSMDARRSAFAEEFGPIRPLHSEKLDRAFIRRMEAVTLRADQMRVAILRGEPVDADQLRRLLRISGRILGAIARRTARRKPAAPCINEHQLENGTQNG